MNRALKLLLLIAIAFAPLSCTRNCGNIGDWFGIWKLESITVNGESDPYYHGNVFWRFQTNMILMTYTYETNYDASGSYGTWTENNNILELNFSYYTEGESEQGAWYIPPAVTHIPAGISRLSVLHLSRKEIKLSYLSQSDGKEYFYLLKKWG